MSHYFALTKFGIVCFVLFTATGGFFLGLPFFDDISVTRLSTFLFGLMCLSSGSFALNMYQERNRDALMARTKKRPLPNGDIPPKNALIFSLVLLAIGTWLCFHTSWKVGVLGLVTVFFYNGLYTEVWKGRSAFAAVPGAIPGAMPFVLGYTAASGNVFTIENIYFFLVMFLWQMPHYWTLALKYKEDYRKAHIPVLPAERGVDTTVYYMGLYTFAYVALAVAAPFFAPVGWFYLVIALPFAFKVMWEFFKFIEAPTQKRWLPFFMWTTFSILVFIFVPAVDRWTQWLY